eukprot:COSAG01_NODE_9196_length_2524_cov_1.633402_2_plen_82_part_00
MSWFPGPIISTRHPMQFIMMRSEAVTEIPLRFDSFHGRAVSSQMESARLAPKGVLASTALRQGFSASRAWGADRDDVIAKA